MYKLFVNEPLMQHFQPDFVPRYVSPEAKEPTLTTQEPRLLLLEAKCWTMELSIFTPQSSAAAAAADAAISARGSQDKQRELPYSPQTNDRFFMRYVFLNNKMSFILFCTHWFAKYKFYMKVYI